MLVKFYKNLNEPVEFETKLTFIKEILNEIKQKYGETVSDTLAYTPQLYFSTKDNLLSVIKPEALTSELDPNGSLLILPAIEGEEPISATMLATMAASMVSSSSAVLATMGAYISTYAVAIAAVANTIIGIGVSMGISAIMAPDTNFGDDPARAQAKRDSNLFNSAPTITEQGGSVPICYGNPFCGGVLISSSLTSTDVKKP